jgi:hypothetical protein
MSWSLVTLLGLVLTAISQSPQTSSQSQTSARPQNHSTCSLTPGQAPAVRGIKLGMSVEQVLSIFPESSERPDVKQALGNSESYPTYGIAHLYFQMVMYPSLARDRFAGIDGIAITLFDGRVVELQIIYAGRNSSPRGPFWPNVEDFVSKLSEAYALPDARDWHQFGPGTKVLQCNGINLEANLMGGGAGFSFALRTTKYLDTSKERGEEVEEKIRREFKP